MIRKIVMFMILTLFSFVFLTSVSASTLTKYEYRNQIEMLEEEIFKLKKEIESVEEQKNTINDNAEKIKKEYDDKVKVEDMYNWFNKCSIYDVMSNIKIEIKSYNTFLGIETSSSTSKGSGVIVGLTESNQYVVLTSYYVIQPKSGYKKATYKLIDSFGNVYEAKVGKSDIKLGLSALVFTKNNKSDLYSISLSADDAVSGDPICNIYSFENSGFNHMSFSNVIGYKNKNNYCDFKLLENIVDIKNNNEGSMSVNLNGQLVAITICCEVIDGNNYCYGVPISKIRYFLYSN